MREYLPLFFLLVLLAAVFRDDAVVLLFYLLAGVFIAGRWWSRKALASVVFERRFTRRAFPGEAVPVRLAVRNTGWLPLIWLGLRESVPAGLTVAAPPLDVVSLGPRGQAGLDYTLQTYKRGYYQIGPLFLSSGDVLGLDADHQRQGPADTLTVYPRLVPLTQLGLPSRSPLGTLRHAPPIFEDPARVVGKRDYASGDSLRRLDWKATAAAGRLQVKQFEPSIALEVMLLLDLRAESYALRARYDASELAIVAAASLADWLTGQKQPVGLLANGADPASGDGPPILPPRKGRGHLMRVLEVLARVQLAEAAPPVADLVRRQSAVLPWGATLVTITGGLDEALTDASLHARRAGLNVVLMLVGPVTSADEARRRLKPFGVTVHALWNEQDLAPWRG